MHVFETEYNFRQVELDLSFTEHSVLGEVVVEVTAVHEVENKT